MFYDLSQRRISGPNGDLVIPPEDPITPRLLMLIEGECEGLGPMQAAQKHGLSRQRYYQVHKQFQAQGVLGLQNQKRGPKTNSVRTDEVERQVIRHRFLDPDASVNIIAQKLRQTGFAVSTRPSRCPPSQPRLRSPSTRPGRAPLAHPSINCSNPTIRSAPSGRPSAPWISPGWLREIKAVEGHVGRDATDPRLLVALWVYATLKGIRVGAGTGRVVWPGRVPAVSVALRRGECQLRHVGQVSLSGW